MATKKPASKEEEFFRSSAPTDYSCAACCGRSVGRCQCQMPDVRPEPQALNYLPQPLSVDRRGAKVRFSLYQLPAPECIPKSEEERVKWVGATAVTRLEICGTDRHRL
jgi:hypothetical protein